jgi:hypothetical protein
MATVHRRSTARYPSWDGRPASRRARRQRRPQYPNERPYRSAAVISVWASARSRYAPARCAGAPEPR